MTHFIGEAVRLEICEAYRQVQVEPTEPASIRPCILDQKTGLSVDFLEFGLSDLFDFTYCDSWQWHYNNKWSGDGRKIITTVNPVLNPLIYCVCICLTCINIDIPYSHQFSYPVNFRTGAYEN